VRFAVHGPGNPVASPRSHGMPRRDVDGRIHVRMALLHRLGADGQVPHVPGMAAVVPQHRLLGGRGEEPVPGHANTLSDTTDITGEVRRCSLPGLKTGEATPRS